MVEKKLVPALRFPEFEGEWSCLKLSHISTEVGYGIGSSAVEFDGLNQYLRITDIDETSNQFTPKPLTSPEGNIDKKYYLQKGDIVFARTGASVGKSYIYDEKDGVIVFAGFLIKFSIIKAEPKFVFYNTLTSKYWKWVQVMSMRSGQPGLNAEELKSLKISLPSLPEQQKIASFLTSVDEKIRLLTEKKALLEQYKKGVMQQLFSQQLRFKDDNGKDFPDWEIIRAKELFKNHSNKNHNGELQILSASQEAGMVYRKDNGLKIQSSEKSIKGYKIVEIGDFVISLRSFQGGIEYSNVHGICSPAYTILKPKKPIIHTFFKFYFKKESFIERLSKTVVGIRDGKQITYDAFGGLKLQIPSLKEQTKIADFLSSIDSKIEKVATQLQHTQQFKKGLLQQLFV